MNKIREWGFPVGLIIAWIVASGYTMSALAGFASEAAGYPASQRVETAQTRT